MTKLEDITVGSSVKGIISNSTVTIVAVQWYGNNVLEITYKDSHGQPGNQMLLRDEEINLTVMDNSLPWSFDADGEQMKLASEAYRISLAHLFDPYLLCILPQWNRFRIRFQLSIKRCCRSFRCAMCLRMTPVPVKQS